MIVIVGFLVVIGGILAGFLWAGGSIPALIHPSEIVTIGGAVMGAMIVMSPKKVLMDLMAAVIGSLKGTPFNKAAYEEMFKCLYDLFRVARREGLIALEQHVSNAHESELFKKYPKIHGNHHVCEFVCGALSPIIEGTVKPEQLPGLLEGEIKVLEGEHHAAISVLAKTADALPGFGIVAAVLGIVITMGAINGPVDEIGEKVGAALVGTFIGILASYGFIQPLAAKMQANIDEDGKFLKVIKAALIAYAKDCSPKVCVEFARRSIAPSVRPTFEEVDQATSNAGKS